jgi:hypothetical protein
MTLELYKATESVKSFANSDDFKKLETLLGEYNIFEAIGMTSQEIRHSVFLSFLLSPLQNHGLGDIFLKATLCLADCEIDKLDLSGTIIKREWHNIDIFAINEPNQIAVIIENKIYSDESGNQLERYYEIVNKYYPNYQMICIYLTREGNLPSHSAFQAISYHQLTKEIERLAENHSVDIEPTARITMSHYVRMLRRHLLNDVETRKLCRDIYKQHKQAIDLIIKNIPQFEKQLHKEALRLVENTPELILDWDKYGVRFFTFCPHSWDGVIPRRIKEDSWKWGSNTGRGLLFQFDIQRHEMSCRLHIRYPSPDNQRKLEDITKANPSWFIPPRPIIGYEDIIEIYERIILTEARIAEATFDELLGDFNTWWTDFITTDLPAIEAIFVDGMQKATL